MGMQGILSWALRHSAAMSGGRLKRSSTLLGRGLERRCYASSPEKKNNNGRGGAPVGEGGGGWARVLHGSGHGSVSSCTNADLDKLVGPTLWVPLT